MARSGRQGQHLKNLGLYTGGNWPEYRYGHQKRPVYNPAKVQRSVIGDADRKASLVKQTAEQLRAWDSSPFQHEAACRHGLRQAFCEGGHRWQRSDDAAALIVSEALLDTGAKRPSYAEGQWEYAVSTEYCVSCHGPIDDEGMARGNRFCSPECAKNTYERRAYGEIRTQYAVAQNAYAIIKKDQAPQVQCQHCQCMFKRYKIESALKRGEGKFCSKACHDASMRVYADRDCVVCGKAFHPQKETQLCCSRACAVTNQIKPLNANCQQCAKPFRSYRKGTDSEEKYCSRSCFHASKASRSIPKECEWCGDSYTAKGEKGRYCTPRCQSIANDYANGLVPVRLSIKVFDHFFTMPINATRPAWMTPERFDEMVAA